TPAASPRSLHAALPIFDVGDSLVAGPDGNVWFTVQAASQVGKITPGGAVTLYNVLPANSQAFSIISGPDGNLWLLEPTTDALIRSEEHTSELQSPDHLV